MDSRTTVFEAVNRTLKEIFVGLCSEPVTLLEIERRMQEARPPAVGHWQSGQDISCRCVEADLTEPDGRAFLPLYARRISQDGWTVLTE